jgi:hypothetical protein
MMGAMESTTVHHGLGRLVSARIIKFTIYFGKYLYVIVYIHLYRITSGIQLLGFTA